MENKIGSLRQVPFDTISFMGIMLGGNEITQGTGSKGCFVLH